MVKDWPRNGRWWLYGASILPLSSLYALALLAIRSRLTTQAPLACCLTPLNSVGVSVHLPELKQLYSLLSVLRVLEQMSDFIVNRINGQLLLAGCLYAGDAGREQGVIYVQSSFLLVASRNLSLNPRHVFRYFQPHLREKETAMFVIVKWIAAALFAGFAWLVTGYTIEYFMPYKNISVRLKKKD